MSKGNTILKYKNVTVDNRQPGEKLCKFIFVK